MNRRELLGLCAGGCLVGLAGCLDLVAGTVARTRAYPAFVLPPVGEWRDRLDGGRGSLRSNNHNTTRSNRTSLSAGPTGDVTIGWTVDATEYRSRNFNEGRQGGEGRTFDAPDADRERTYAYLEDAPVIGETFVVSIPSVDLPGVEDPAGQIGPGDVVPTGGALRTPGDGDSPKAVVAELIAFSDLSDVTGLERAVNKASPYLYQGVTRRKGGDAGPFVVQWKQARTEGSNADAVSEPVLASATATLDDGVRLPVILYARRVRHGGDYLFVVGWVVDAGALYADATTLLVDGGPTQVVDVGPDEVRQPGAPAALVESLTERERMGALLFDGPAREDLRRFLPERFREGDGAAAFVDAARRSSGAGRTDRGAGELRIPAFEETDDDPPESEVLDVTVCNLDATIGHLDSAYSGEFADVWSEAA